MKMKLGLFGPDVDTYPMKKPCECGCPDGYEVRNGIHREEKCAKCHQYQRFIPKAEVRQ